LIPALADDQSEPNASPPDGDLMVVGDFVEEAADIGFVCESGAGA